MHYTRWRQGGRWCWWDHKKLRTRGTPKHFRVASFARRSLLLTYTLQGSLHSQALGPTRSAHISPMRRINYCLCRASCALASILFAVERVVYRTGNEDLLSLGKALRKEDFDAALPIVRMCLTTVLPANEAVTDIVHDNSEKYPTNRKRERKCSIWLQG
jgi:hypothetical protein